MTLKGFKKFTKVRCSTKPFVSIRKSNHIAVSSGAVTKYDLAYYEYAILYISDDRCRVAVQFTNDEKADGILKIIKRPGNFSICADAFLKIYDIAMSETKNFEINWIEPEKTIVIRIKENEKINGFNDETFKKNGKVYQRAHN